jgi:hypothetical protein
MDVEPPEIRKRRAIVYIDGYNSPPFWKRPVTWPRSPKNFTALAASFTEFKHA